MGGKEGDRPIDGLQNLLPDTILGFQTTPKTAVAGPTGGAYSAHPDSLAHWEGLAAPLSNSATPASVLGASSFGPSGLDSPLAPLAEASGFAPTVTLVPLLTPNSGDATEQ